MQAVVQEDLTGCGIASVAVLAGQSYQQVRRVAGELGIDVQDPRLWSGTTYVRTLLGHYGIRATAGETPFDGRDALPDLALLAIKWRLENGRPFWHWVVYRRGPQGAVVFDPKRTLRRNTRTDFGRIRPKWFIAVDPRRGGQAHKALPIAAGVCSGVAARIAHPRLAPSTPGYSCS